MALRNPGRWVLAQKYKNARSASGVAYEYRHRYPELEITTRDNELYMRSPAPETKETK